MQSKKALSELIAYVILISITLALSVMVFAWVKCYIPGSCSKETVKCPEGAALVVKNYICNLPDGKINITVQNKGLFSVDGFVVRMNDRVSNIAIYTLKDFEGNKYGQKLAPGEEISKLFSLSTDSIEGNPNSICGNFICSVKLIVVQPFVNATGANEKVFCESASSQTVDC